MLGPGATLWVPKLIEEIADCQVSSQRLSIDPQAMIIEEADPRGWEGGRVGPSL